MFWPLRPGMRAQVRRLADRRQGRDAIEEALERAEQPRERAHAYTAPRIVWRMPCIVLAWRSQIDASTSRCS